MDQLESLSAALPDNVAQLAQLDELLQADPDNAELQAIRDDLQQVITTTLELQAQDALNKSAATGGAEAAAAAAAGTVAAAAVPAASSPSYAAAPAVAALAAADLLHPYVSPLGADGLYPVGARVSAVYAKDGRSYLARVDSVDEGAETYRVTYLEYGQQATVPFEQVTPWRSATAEQLRMPNVPVKARWPEDGLFYAASLDGPSPDLPGHYVVRFGAAVGITGNKKKKKVDVALHDIVLNEKFIDPRSLQLTSAASAAAKAAAAPLSEELVVPPHLVVHDTDSDAVKAGKLKKLKKLRYDHKRAWEAAQTDARKNSWLDFKAGKTVGGKKAKIAAAPGLAALQKPSMFATPDTIEGRVGVVGSGREMTEQTSLKRHVFDKSDASM